jgi:hypothetical protein
MSITKTSEHITIWDNLGFIVTKRTKDDVQPIRYEFDDDSYSLQQLKSIVNLLTYVINDEEDPPPF